MVSTLQSYPYPLNPLTSLHPVWDEIIVLIWMICNQLISKESGEGYLLDVSVNYEPYTPDDLDCSLDYIHVGNDGNNIDLEKMTSYKYCKTLYRENVVSRYNYLWIVVSTSREPARLQFEVTARPKVECNSTMEFECSPTQCIPTSAVCDGTADCYNGRDEFCMKQYEDNSCFYCFDGTCINPVLPRYHDNWGKELWYLCDEYQHCHDGTDERKDICYRVDSRVASMMYCEPSKNSTGQSVLMWNTLQCDGIQHCRDGSDESKERCSDGNEKESIYKPVSIIIIICFLIFSIIGTLVALKVYKRQQRKRINSELNQIETTHLHSESDTLTQKVCSIAQTTDPDHCESISEDSLSLTSSNPGTLKSYQDVKLEWVEHQDDGTVEYIDDNGVRYTDL
ncbi:hypothetical protein LOTGIDRAFT_237075 [Lottia gigantea]|uniref:CUB domain-containing protein n=1 Tax=Lottia gigantea TaxID=225164 RepID=V3ZDX3_LOTGI|nr:hypothetical protein LOTGIDRAFT_237075 [Lottia gigantea]ESO82252.1 hypothetical protein LOTGIDRAFT_237075 [Lottia gigantea]